MFIDNLLKIKEDLNNHKRTKSEVMTECISKRLQLANINYMEDLDRSISYLLNRQTIRIVKKLNKDG